MPLNTPYFSLSISFIGKVGKQRKSRRQSLKIPHDIPMANRDSKIYTEKSVFIDTVINDFIQESDIKLDSLTVRAYFTYSIDHENGLTTAYPFNELTHNFEMTLAHEVNL